MQDKAPVQADGTPSAKESVLPEVEIYGYLVGLVYFIDHKDIDAVSFGIARSWSKARVQRKLAIAAILWSIF
jgi:hypothetical protein